MKKRRKNTEVQAAINVYRELHGEGYFEGLSSFVVTVLNLSSSSSSSSPLSKCGNTAFSQGPLDLIKN